MEPSRRGAPAARPHPAESTAASELALLDQARRAIAEGSPARALSILDAYASRYPRGVMAPEASVLRVEALAAAGDRNAVKREGEAFLRANPSSPYAARVQSLIGSSGAANPSNP
jgi:outer membrane protein assembly factor BamD (BamD/ComL family)